MIPLCVTTLVSSHFSTNQILKADEDSGSHLMRVRMEAFIRRKQEEIISALEAVDGTKFRADEWKRPNGGGGGRTCVLQDGHVFEKAGVNISIVHGQLNRSAVDEMRQNHKNIANDTDELDFYALALSMVVHPKNPMAHTVHMNGRCFETVRDGSAQTAWFGGGSDLTLSHLFKEDAKRFHATLKAACDEHDVGYYPKFKKWCDEYFNIIHRGERRRVGGIFFDDLDENFGSPEESFAFLQATINALVPAYVLIVEKRKDLPFNEQEKQWQQIRRGRYVEFNLVHDRGTAFGLNVPGSRVESILISLPVTAQWHYMFDEPGPDGQDGKLVEVLGSPREWVSIWLCSLSVANPMILRELFAYLDSKLETCGLKWKLTSDRIIVATTAY